MNSTRISVRIPNGHRSRGRSTTPNVRCVRHLRTQGNLRMTDRRESGGNCSNHNSRESMRVDVRGKIAALSTKAEAPSSSRGPAFALAKRFPCVSKTRHTNSAGEPSAARKLSLESGSSGSTKPVECPWTHHLDRITSAVLFVCCREVQQIEHVRCQHRNQSEIGTQTATGKDHGNQNL